MSHLYHLFRIIQCDHGDKKGRVVRRCRRISNPEHQARLIALEAAMSARLPGVAVRRSQVLAAVIEAGLGPVEKEYGIRGNKSWAARPIEPGGPRRMPRNDDWTRSTASCRHPARPDPFRRGPKRSRGWRAASHTVR